MRVAALYDIHGNLPALEAVLTDVRNAGVDLVLIGGDVLPGPMPAETLSCLADLDIPTACIHGNGDRVVAAALAGGDISEVPEPFRDGIRWTADQLSADQREMVAQWPATREVDLDGLGTVLFCHATPRNDVDCFTRTTAAERVAPVFSGVTAPIVVCGHTHMPFDRRIGTCRVVNAGSVGMPFAAPRGAYWLLLVPGAPRGPGIELRRTDYDVERAARLIRGTGYPQADWVIRYVLDPPPEEESLRLFAGAELI
jgi:putative phosphoesterase